MNGGRARAIGVVCHPSLGGSGVVAAALAVGLAKRGHHVHVISTGPLARPLPDCENLQLHIAQAPEYPLFEQTPQLLAVASTIAQVCDAHALEILHVHYAVPHASSAFLARQLLGARAPALVTALHGTDVTSVGLEPAYHAITRMCVEASDAITTPSDFLREQARHALGIAAEHAIEVLPNGVDTDYFTPPETRDRRHFDALFPAAESGEHSATLVHISNFRPVKRPRDVIDVFARVHERLPARLLLVGDGPQLAGARARASELGLGQHVRFVGARPSVREYLQHADGLLVTSETESFGLAALEALSCGVPVFGYRVGGLPSVVTDDVGALVTPFDAAALTDAVVTSISDARAQEARSLAARARAVEHFRMQPILELHERLFERVSNQKR